MARARVAAVGDSLTAGARCGVDDAWPAMLNRNGLYTVRNFALAGVKAEDYGATHEFQELMHWNPSVVTLMLGTFDAGPGWHLDNYVNTLRWMIQIIQNDLATLPHVVLMIPPPLFVDGTQGLSSDIISGAVPVRHVFLFHDVALQYCSCAPPSASSRRADHRLTTCAHNRSASRHATRKSSAAAHSAHAGAPVARSSQRIARWLSRRYCS